MLTDAQIAAPKRETRRGFTLVELLMSMVMLAIVSGAILTFLLRQQRFYNAVSEIQLTRAQVRQATGLLPGELKGISSVGNDLYIMSDTALEFRSTFGSAVICVNQTGKTSYITVPPTTLAKGSVLTNWTRTPVVGDSLLLYVDSTSTASRDDIWSAHAITAITPVTTDATTGCPSTSGLMKSTDVSTSNPSYQFVVSPSASKTVNVAAAVRFFRRVHYSLYKASDNKWYLAYYDCLPGRTPVCNSATPQLLAGPFRAFSNGHPEWNGLRFAYFDTTGVETTTKTQVSRISILVQGESQNNIQLSGPTAVTFRDSVRIDIGLRNWK